MVTLQTADSVLKNYYLDAITKEIDDMGSLFFGKIESTSANVVGKGVSKVVRLGVNGGVGAGTEMGELPYSEASSYITLNASLKNLYGTIEISDKAIRASANNDGAFVNLLNEEMENLIKSAKYNFSRMLFGDGNGTIGHVVGQSGRKITLDRLSGLEEGMHVDIWKNGVLTYSYIKVCEVLKSESAIVFDPEYFDEGDNIMDSDIRAVGVEEGYELTGLDALFSDEPIYGVDRTYSYMKPYIKEDAGEISEDDIQLIIDSIEEKSGSKVNMLLCSWAVRRAITRIFKDRQNILSMQDVGNGQQVLTFNGIPIVVDRFCPEGTLYFLNTDDFKLCQLCDWQWMEGEDGKLLKQVPGKPVYMATLVKYAELICEKPCGQGVMRGIAI